MVLAKWPLAGLMVIGAGLASQPASAQTQANSGGVQAGLLSCDVSNGWGLVVTSSRDLRCTYSNRGMADEYVGHVTRLGVDIGYHGAGKLVWAVIATNPDVPKGALAGTYSGVSGGAAIGVGAGANVLVGAGKAISLQPVSVEGMTGVNVAAGVGQIRLAEAQPGPEQGMTQAAVPPQEPVGMPSNQQPDPNNCGTPDDPKSCPPLPRHALNYYPANRKD